MTDADKEAQAHVESTRDRMAPPGKIWACPACGKRSRDRYGLEDWHSYGWDESCMLNAVLVREEAFGHRSPEEEAAAFQAADSGPIGFDLNDLPSDTEWKDRG